MLTKKIVFSIILSFSSLFISACSSENMLTKEELQIQLKAENAVSKMVFDSSFSNKVSYKVNKDGSVLINFAPEIELFDFAYLIQQLRSHRDIKSVIASQAGTEVCQLN